MSSQRTQFVKEARQIFWPWLAVSAAALLAQMDVGQHGGAFSVHGFLRQLLPFGAICGLPFLASLPLGNEFQYRTLTLSLSQPITRGALWRSKFLITLAAVVPAAALYCLTAWLHHDLEPNFWLLAAAWITVATAGAIFWTLVARSTTGGLALSVGFNSVLFLGWSKLASALTTNDGGLPATLVWGTAVVVFAYAVVLVGLGRRALLRFQAVEGMQADETFIPGAELVPAALSRWLRCRPRGVVLNLVRRELHLLRAVWPLSGLVMLAWV